MSKQEQQEQQPTKALVIPEIAEAIRNTDFIFIYDDDSEEDESE